MHNSAILSEQRFQTIRELLACSMADGKCQPAWLPNEVMWWLWWLPLPGVRRVLSSSLLRWRGRSRGCVASGLAVSVD